ncbi:hypothetical protein SDC9_75282 [bioreactor metagenome]|uniref:DZANK-type domain-containing protein n=1 Tax=bioreactor metagenome TaxID=1076179 RepID=A0A644YRQ2_9ZZZZ
MGFMDKVGNAANVAKWKADQQVRIIKKQGEIRDIESKLYIQKSQIAETVLYLYKQNKIQNVEVTDLCEIAAQIQGQIDQLKIEIEMIRQEFPPVQVVSLEQDVAYSGLVCPVCGERLAGKFCAVHGVEGVPQTPVSNMVCPVCGQEFVGKFCPKDGSEGVLKQG